MKKALSVLSDEHATALSSVAFMGQANVGCERRPAALTLERDLAVMEHLEFRSMGDADDGRDCRDDCGLYLRVHELLRQRGMNGVPVPFRKVRYCLRDAR